MACSHNSWGELMACCPKRMMRTYGLWRSHQNSWKHAHRANRVKTKLACTEAVTSALWVSLTRWLCLKPWLPSCIHRLPFQPSPFCYATVAIPWAARGFVVRHFCYPECPQVLSLCPFPPSSYRCYLQFLALDLIKRRHDFSVIGILYCPFRLI